MLELGMADGADGTGVGEMVGRLLGLPVPTVQLVEPALVPLREAGHNKHAAALWPLPAAES